MRAVVAREGCFFVLTGARGQAGRGRWTVDQESMHAPRCATPAEQQ